MAPDGSPVVATSAVYLQNYSYQLTVIHFEDINKPLAATTHACRGNLMPPQTAVPVSQEQERVLQLGASDFLLLVLAVVALFVVLPKLAYRYASSKAVSKRD
ncbi:hypothetical protein N2152v2_004722 [Parachlorella kessleri]